MLPLQHYFQLGRILVANGQPKCAVGLEHAHDFGRPIAAPSQIVFAFQAVVIHIVVVADIERRVGKRQIDRAVSICFIPAMQSPLRTSLKLPSMCDIP